MEPDPFLKVFNKEEFPTFIAQFMKDAGRVTNKYKMRFAIVIYRTIREGLKKKVIITFGLRIFNDTNFAQRPLFATQIDM